MSLRRFAQENAMASPRKSAAGSSGSSTPSRGPSTPERPRSGYVQVNRSPLLLPSQSASNPFDWDAARGQRPPPYPSPIARKARRSEVGVGNGAPETPKKKRVVRQKSMVQKIRDFPSQVAFEWSLFPHNLPIPESKTSALLLGGGAHFLHFCIRVLQLREVPDSTTGWEDMYREENGGAWFDWTVFLTMILICASLGSTAMLFTHTRTYHLHSQSDPVASPHARFVREPEAPPSISRRLRIGLWAGLKASFAFLFNWTSSASGGPAADASRRVQALEIWDPSSLELTLFSVYSPVHALLWISWNASNWMVVSLVMAGVSAQMRALVLTYEAKLKDRLIIAAEAMHEYDQKFVNPRLNPVRRDASVMTHESEMVSHR